MRIEVRLYASLERYMRGEKGSTSFQYVEAAEGATVGDILQMVRVPAEAVKLIFVNSIHARMDQVLREGDRMGVFPPVAGG